MRGTLQRTCRKNRRNNGPGRKPADLVDTIFRLRHIDILEIEGTIDALREFPWLFFGFYRKHITDGAFRLKHAGTLPDYFFYYIPALTKNVVARRCENNLIKGRINASTYFSPPGHTCRFSHASHSRADPPVKGEYTPL
jgi:hypothetical protein